MKARSVDVIANGRPETVVIPCSVKEYLLQHGWSSSQVVVEHNGRVLARDAVAATMLAAGDRLEIIVPVAGG